MLAVFQVNLEVLERLARSGGIVLQTRCGVNGCPVCDVDNVTTYLAWAVGALDAELVHAARRVLANDGLEDVVRVPGLHRRQAVRQPLWGGELV